MNKLSSKFQKVEEGLMSENDLKSKKIESFFKQDI